MPKISIFTWLALTLAFSLAACSPQPTPPSATATHQSASATPSPSAIALPPTPTASPTPIPGPTAAPIFPVPEAKCLDEENHTGPLPPHASSAYNLKPQTEAEAIALIQQFDQTFPPCDKPRARAMGADLEQKERRSAIQLALVETLQRYPNSAHRKELEWHLAQVNASLYDHSSDAWLVETIQQALNQGGYTFETLPSLVEPYGFQIPIVNLYRDAPNGMEVWFGEHYENGEEVQFIQVENLFGDGQTAQVFWLMDRYYSGGLLIVARKNADGVYTLNLLHSGFLGDIYFGDHTQDGLPEMTLTTGARYGSMCGTYLYIYQWQGQYFNDLTRGGLRTEQCSDAIQYQKTEPPGPDTFEFVFSENFLKNKYAWNGSFYELVNDDAENYRFYGEFRHISDLMLRGEYPATLQTIHTESENTAAVADIGPSYPDYLHFQIGLVYALQSQTEAARNEFQKLVDAPANPKARMIPNAAQAFLKAYQGDGDIYRACLTALQVNLKTIAPYRKAGGFYSVDSQAALRILGLKPDDFSGAEQQICDPQAVFPPLVKNLQLSNTEDVPAALRQAGVELLNAQQVDVNNNGQPDWVIAISYPYYSGSAISRWVLLQRSTGLEAVSINWLITDSNNINTLDTFKVEIVPLPGDAPMVFWQTNRDLVIFQVFDTAPNRRVYIHYPDTYNYNDDQVKLFSIQPDSDSLGYQVWYLPHEYTPDWETYRWDAKTYHFALTDRKMSAAQIADDGPVDAAHQAQAKLLDEWQPGEAIALLKTVLATTPGKSEGSSCLPDENCVERPRLRYLLGLAYELSGDEKLAAQTYWQVWHDYPESSYAVLAQAKLK